MTPALVPRSRSRNGRYRQPPDRERLRQQETMAVALAQPHRNGNPSSYAGHAFGRTLLAGLISVEQYDAGLRYTAVLDRYLRTKNPAPPRWPSLLASHIAAGLSCDPEPEPEDIDKLERDFADALGAMADVGELPKGPGVLMAVCLLDRDPTQDQIGVMRVVLNALHRLWNRS